MLEETQVIYRSLLFAFLVTTLLEFSLVEFDIEQHTKATVVKRNCSIITCRVGILMVWGSSQQCYHMENRHLDSVGKQSNTGDIVLYAI